MEGARRRPHLAEVLPPLALPKGEVDALCAAGGSALLAHVAGVGFKSVDLSVDAGAAWREAGRYGGAVAAELGLQVSPGAEGRPARVSFVDGSRSAWVCLRLPAAGGEGSGEAEAEEVHRAALPADVAAVAAAEPGDSAATLVLSTGAVRMYDLRTGQAHGKGAKLGGPVGSGAACAARLGDCRAAVVRAAAKGAKGLSFFVVEFDSEGARATCTLRGTFQDLPSSPLVPGLLPSSLRIAATGSQRDSLMLCWQREGGVRVAASAELGHEAPRLRQLAVEADAPACWLCLSGYLAELSGSSPARLTVRDAGFGMEIASVNTQLTPNAKGVLAATAGDHSLFVAAGVGGSAVRWSLPRFGLQMLIGTQASTAPEKTADDPLAPLREAVYGKRPREEPPALRELFSTPQRKAATDRALAAALKERRWATTPELVDEVARRECWASAAALLTLPELDELHTARLLKARPELLARVVRRASRGQLLDTALREVLSQADMPRILETLLEWLEAYRNFAESTVRESAPGVPPLAEVVAFLRALADGCLAALARVEPHLLERVDEALRQVQSDARKSEQMRNLAQEWCRAPKRRRRSDAKVEVLLLNF